MTNTSPEFYWIAVALVTILSASRLTRLATFDKFPPVKWLRDKYEDRTDGSDWQLLAMCGYCASFWVTALVVGTGYFAGAYDHNSTSDWNFIWWVLNGTLAASYLAAVFMAIDQDPGDEAILAVLPAPATARHISQPDTRDEN